MGALNLIVRGEPSAVTVGGSLVPINSGFRANLLAETLDRRDARGRRDLLMCWFAKGGELREDAARDPYRALAAACEWHDAAWGLMSYGMPGRGRASRRRVFDWDADAAAVACDFERVYGIDLTDPATQMHWYRFMTLFSGLLRTEDALCRQAVAARSPLHGKRSKAERDAHEALSRAWALPPTEDELIEMARREF